jgi:hypothetical protein
MMRVRSITAKLSQVTSGGVGALRRARAVRPISRTASSRKTKIPAAASVSYLRWP